VGQYLNDHFVAAFQKVSSFKIVNGQKQGGNVASYFCTPEGRVLDAVAGPVDGATLLREARWVVETCNLAELDGKTGDSLKGVFGKAHADRLLHESGLRSDLRPRADFTDEDVAALLERGRGMDSAARIHLLLSTYPLPPIGKVYRPIFERLLNEPVSTSPVQLGEGARFTGGTPVRLAPLSAAERRLQRREEQVAEARGDPPRLEMLSGRSLNILMSDLRRLDDEGATLADVTVDREMLSRIRVVAANHGDVGPALVLLSPLLWPESLRIDDFAEGRARVEATLAVAREQAAKGPVGREAWQAVHDAVNLMDQRLTAKIQSRADSPKWTTADAVEAGAFMNDLSKSAEVLQQPDVAGYLNGKYTAKGATVMELIRNMASNGLRFSAALPGDDPAYRALQQALARCDARAHAGGE